MKLLVILPRFPYPTEKGDKLRAFNQLKSLSRHHDITLFALSHEVVKKSDLEKVTPYCSKVVVYRLRFFSVIINLLRSLWNDQPLQAGYYYNKRAQSSLNMIIKQVKPDHVYCQLVRTAAYAFNIKLLKTLDYQDVFSKGLERRIPKANVFFKILLRFELRRLRRFENLVFDKFNNKTIISKPDRNCIPHNKREQIVIIPNGVDQEFFKPFEQELISELLFTGNMGYAPNIDCAEFLVKKVLPIIHQTHPGARLTIAGASPHPKVKALASNHVIVTGWVDDMRVYYSGAKVFMAPMQLGTGLQNKLLEAMAMQLPCITSQLCNDALLANENIEILIGNTPEEVAKQTIKLLDDSAMANQIAQNGYSFVKTNYTWEGSTAKLSSLMENTRVEI